MCEDLFKVLVEFLGTENVEIRYPNALEQTVPDMLSSDYKRRFKAEYHQLRYRYHKLCRFIRKVESGQVKSDCSLDLLKRQRNIMCEYLDILSERSFIEDVDIL